MKKNILLFILLVFIMLLNVNTYAKTDNENSSDSISVEEETIFGEDKVINEVMDKNINIFNSNVEINNTVKGDINCFFSEVKINSTIEGNVICFFGEINIGENGKVEGDLINFFEGKEGQLPEININDDINLTLPEFGEREIFKFKLVILIVGILITFIFSMLFILIFKNWLNDITSCIEYEFPKKFGIGFLIYLAVLILLILTFYLIIPIIIWLILVVILNTLFMLFLGRIVIRIASVNYNIFIEFIIGYFIFLAFKIGILILLPASSILLYVLVSFILDVVVKSLGFGIFTIGVKSENN
jgi:hypothetical protein